MSKQIQASESFFDVYKQNVDKYFENAAEITPQHQQTWTNIQSEWYKSWQNTINATISLQQEFAKKTGIDTTFQRQQKI